MTASTAPLLSQRVDLNSSAQSRGHDSICRSAEMYHSCPTASKPSCSRSDNCPAQCEIIAVNIVLTAILQFVCSHIDT